MQVLLLCLLLLTGCANTPPVALPKQCQRTDIKSCLPNAVILCKELQKVGIRAEILLIVTTKTGHAVVVYIYKSKLYVWDADNGSIEIAEQFENHYFIARKFLNQIGVLDTIKYTQYY